VLVSLVVCALRCERRVWVCVDSSAKGTLPFAGWETLEAWREGRVAFRYSAGSKEGLRKGCRAGSATCADLGSKVMAATGRFCGWIGLVAALLFWRLRAAFESQAMALEVDKARRRRWRWRWIQKRVSGLWSWWSAVVAIPSANRLWAR
jgi:hypothetical protein